MIKMLLVDDEDLSRFAFRTLLSRHFKHIEIVAEAENGQEAIEAVKKFRPDVVVMDIHMPGIDGLQTMSKIKEIDPQINVLICSAYDNFDYVSKAMDLGAKGYLLKPVSKEDLSEKLVNLDSKTQLISGQALPNTLSDQALIEMMLSGSQGEALKHDLKRMYRTNLEYGLLVLISTNSDDLEDEKAALQQVVNEVLNDSQFSLQAIIGGRLLLFLSGCDSKNTVAIDDTACYNLISLADQIIDSLEQELDYSLKTKSTIVQEGNWLNAWHSLASDQQNATTTEREANQIMSEIIEAVKSNDADIARILLAKWLEIVLPLQPDMRLVLIVQLIFQLNHQLEEMLLQADYRNFHRIISGEIDKNHPEMLDLVVRQQLAATFEALSHRSEKKFDLIEKIGNIIQDQPLSNVTLGSIAEEIGISPQYLCKSFKEDTGSTFHKYLTAKRLAYAKQLLADNSITIKDIALRCGYQDTIYFTKLFKKLNGITPSEYRNRS